MSPLKIRVAARNSPLSQAQVQEVLEELRQKGKAVEFEVVLCETLGDKDKITSLRTLEKTNFFTFEIDQMILNGECRLAIHSAKDLPEPLPRGLQILFLTQGLDPSDSLVMQPGMTLENLPPGAKIAASSFRREERIRQLRSDLRFVDIRGTIGERLEKLERGEVDGVVIAEAALIRLKLTSLNRLRLEGETVPLQGRLALVAREGDVELLQLFS